MTAIDHTRLRLGTTLEGVLRRLESIADCANRREHPCGSCDQMIQAIREEVAGVVEELRSSIPSSSLSGQPCGCDPGAGWVCARHREEREV